MRRWLFSMLSSFLYLIQEKRLKNKDWAKAGVLARSQTAAARISDVAAAAGDDGSDCQSTLRIGFVCMTVGLFAGSLIAQEQVGIGYFADPKVLLSFVMWGLYVVILFIRRNAGLRGRRAAWLTSGVFVLMLCVWAANMLGGSLFRSQVWTEMRFLVTGLNHTTAPVELRERLAIAKEALPETTRALLGEPGVKEAMILSTCNRVELLVSHNGLEPQLPGFLAEHFRLDRSAFWSRTCIGTRMKRRCGTCFAWRRASIRWWWARRRSWGR
jgi:hypothetical protein